MAWTLNSLAGMLKDQARLAEAEQAERKALAIQRTFYAGSDKNVVNTLDQLVDILKKQGKLAEAESLGARSAGNQQNAARCGLSRAR